MIKILFILSLFIILYILYINKNKLYIKNKLHTNNKSYEHFLDHNIKEERNRIRFHSYNIDWMKKAKDLDQHMLQEKIKIMEKPSLCKRGFVHLQNESLHVPLMSYPELGFHPLDEPLNSF